MSVVDHFAIEVTDIDEAVERLTDVHGLELVRYGKRYSTGLPIAMLKDANGFKIEVIQAGEGEPAQVDEPRFAHVAFRVDDVAGREEELRNRGLESRKPAHRLEAAKADAALMEDHQRLQVQLVHYDAGSPDATQP